MEGRGPSGSGGALLGGPGPNIDEEAVEDPEEGDEEEEDEGGDSPPKSKRSRARLVRSGILEKLPPQKGKYKSTEQRRKDGIRKDRIGRWEPDMYKMMDGSALVCLGE